MIRASGLVARNQARDMLEAIGAYAGAPGPDSPAAREQRAAKKRNSVSGATRYRFHLGALSQARLRVAAVHDDMVSVARLLNEDGASLFAHTALSRNACEAAVRAHWLMDPAIGEDERIVRSAVSLYNGMQDRLRGAMAVPAGHPARPPGRLQALEDGIAAYLAETGQAGISTALDSRGARVVAFELGAVRVPVVFNVSEQMAAILPDAPSWYAIGSAATHGSVWGLRGAVTGGEMDDLLCMSPDLLEMGAAAWSLLSAAALVMRTYAGYYGHSPQDRLAKLEERRGVLNGLMLQVGPGRQPQRNPQEETQG
jgi:hypothetical protein